MNVMPASPISLDQKDVEGARVEEKDHLPQVTLAEIETTHRHQSKNPILRTLQRAEAWIDSKVGIETQGIDRIPEDKKRPPSTWNMVLLWFSLNLQVGTLILGILGAEFGLNLKQNIAATTIGTLIGAICPAFSGTMSPKTGLRQIAVSRYSFGWWGAKLCSVLAIIVGGGFFVGQSYFEGSEGLEVETKLTSTTNNKLQTSPTT
jgi:cytosine/uracil/thiamine/allantoin permease